MALFVIYGKPNCGKSHTAWLVYNLIRSAGREVCFEPVGRPKPCYADIIQDMYNVYHSLSGIGLYDFRAIMEYNGKRVAIISAGDMLHNKANVITSFDDNLKWALSNHVDHIVCTARRDKRAGVVLSFIRKKLKYAVYMWYQKASAPKNLTTQINDAKKVAGEIFSDLK